MPVSHGNTWDSNPDTFVLDQHGRSGDGGQGTAHHRAELGPPPTGGGNVDVRYPSPRLQFYTNPVQPCERSRATTRG